MFPDEDLEGGSIVGFVGDEQAPRVCRVIVRPGDPGDGNLENQTGGTVS